MIIVKLSSGLGNQMFQYALGRNLSISNKASFALDISYFARFPHLGRRYSLDIFSIPEDIKIYDKTVPYYDVRNHDLKHRLKKLLGQPPRITEYGYSDELTGLVGSAEGLVGKFDSSVLRAGKDAYLVGFWNNEKYFKNSAAKIRQDFTYKNPPQGKNAKLLAEIARRPSVSLHIRRGDYVGTPEVARTLGSTKFSYYEKAIKLITSKIGQVHIYVFSDEPEWCKQNLKLNNMTIVDHNPPDKGYEDMRLMSTCKHNIIANSTFSWWSAWLNANPDKIIIAPKIWYKDQTINTTDVVPKKWIRI